MRTSPESPRTALPPAGLLLIEASYDRLYTSKTRTLQARLLRCVDLQAALRRRLDSSADAPQAQHQELSSFRVAPA